MVANGMHFIPDNGDENGEKKLLCVCVCVWIMHFMQERV